MDYKDAKIYGLCLQRLRHQIMIAGRRTYTPGDNITLECYNTGDIDDIIELLELYDLEHKTHEALMEKLDDLAYTASILMQSTVYFGFSVDGQLCLYMKTAKEDSGADI